MGGWPVLTGKLSYLLQLKTVTSLLHARPDRDQNLVQILDAALADATRRSGHFLVCRPGCTQCCIGVFAINQLDASRLQEGLANLTQADPARAARVRQRAQASIVKISPDFPGDLATGLLCESKRAQRKFEDFANDEPCPALDPTIGTCDLYAHRPMTCRVFGPPVRTGVPSENQGGNGRSVEESGLGICELCFHGATDAQIAACEMQVDPDGLEPALLGEVESVSGLKGRTIVAFALVQAE
jgi:Fe-S-cluster containining protein